MRLLIFRELKTVKGIPYSRQHVYRLVKLGRFPRPLNPMAVLAVSTPGTRR